MGVFDFLNDLPHYDQRSNPARRMNKRHAMIVSPAESDLEGANVLDLGAHDGRWTYAFAAAGARSVSAVEPRHELSTRYAAFPEAPFKANVHFRALDMFDAMEEDLEAGVQYDVIALLGLLYHVLDHTRIFRLLHALEPRRVIVDSEFMTRPFPMIQLAKERTDKSLNATPSFPEQEFAVVGTPSQAALELLAESFRFKVEWIDSRALYEGDPGGVNDYLREGNKRRSTCHLSPIA